MGNHGDTLPRMEAVKIKAQTDGRKPLPHLITGILTFIATIAVAHFLHTGAPGPQGPSGPAGGTVVKAPAVAGICAYYGPDPTTGHVRFQVSEPLQDSSGAYCKTGVLVSVIPKR